MSLRFQVQLCVPIKDQLYRLSSFGVEGSWFHDEGEERDRVEIFKLDKTCPLAKFKLSERLPLV